LKNDVIVRIKLYVQFSGRKTMRLQYYVVGIAVISVILFSGCTMNNKVGAGVLDAEVGMHATNPHDVVLGTGQPQFVEFFSFY